MSYKHCSFRDVIDILILGKGIRGPSMFVAGAIGAIGGFMLAYQNSHGRLTGYLPNRAEVMASLSSDDQ